MLHYGADRYLIEVRSSKPPPSFPPLAGLCLEQTSLNRTSRYKKADKFSKIVRCFEVASDLTLLYLQKQDKMSSTPSTTSLPSLSASTNTGTDSP